MATAEPISILLCMVWVNMFACDHNVPQDQIGEKKYFRVSYLLNVPNLKVAAYHFTQEK